MTFSDRETVLKFKPRLSLTEKLQKKLKLCFLRLRNCQKIKNTVFSGGETAKKLNCLSASVKLIALQRCQPLLVQLR